MSVLGGCVMVIQLYPNEKTSASHQVVLYVFRGMSPLLKRTETFICRAMDESPKSRNVQYCMTLQ